MFSFERRDAAIWALGAFALLGCDGSSGGAAIPPPPTMIVVDPVQFDDAVSCVDAPGGMRLYVATLFDIAEDYDAAVPQLPSSPPTLCTTPVGFGYVEPSRKYRAEIDGYDIVDLEALTPGNRLLRSTSSGEIVEPRWRASCGNPVVGEPDGGDLSFLGGPAEAYLNNSVIVKGCTPFSDAVMTPASTAIRVDLSDALGALRCGDLPGEVVSYQVSLRDSSAAPSAASCDTAVTFDNLIADQIYFFDVVAFEGAPVPDAGSWDAAVPNTDAAISLDAGSSNDAASSMGLGIDAASAVDATSTAPHWATTCQQRALQGVLQTAICEPLAPIP